MYAFPFSLMYLLFCTDFYIFRNFVFFVFLVVQYRRQARRVDSVEGGSFMFWEVFFSARGASL